MNANRNGHMRQATRDQRGEAGEERSHDVTRHSVKRLVEKAFVLNELERLRVVQGNSRTLSKLWTVEHEDVSDLHYAAFYGDVKSVRRLAGQLGKGNTDVRTGGGPKLLKQVGKDNSDKFQYVTYHGFFLDTTPLMMSSQQGHLDVTKYLTEHARADVNARDSLHLTPLALASAAGHVEVARYLLSKHAKKNEQESFLKMTPLMLATANNQTDMAIFLVKHNCNIHVKDLHGRMAIHYAAWNYNSMLVQYLAAQSHIETAINVQDFEGNTPLHYIVSDLDMAPITAVNFGSDLELEALKNIVTEATCRGHSSVDIRRHGLRGSGNTGEQTSCLVHMIKLGAHMNVKNNSGRTVLHVLCDRLTPAPYVNGYVYVDDPVTTQTLLVMLMLLLRSGARRAEHDEAGNTAISLCVQRRNWVAVKMLGFDGDSPPRSELTVTSDLNLVQTVELCGWAHLIHHTDLLQGIGDMSTALLAATGKQTKTDCLAQRVMKQASIN